MWNYITHCLSICMTTCALPELTLCTLDDLCNTESCVTSGQDREITRDGQELRYLLSVTSMHCI